MGILKKETIYNKILDKKIANIKVAECIKDNKLSPDITIIKRIGTPSIQGEVFLAKKSDSYEIVIKKTPLIEYFFKNYKKFSTKIISESIFLTELLFLTCCKTLLNKKTTPFLPFMYNFAICKDDCGFTNKKITDQYYENEIQGCGYLIVEKAEGDLANFLDDKSYTYPQLLIIFYQIFSGLVMLKKYVNLQHGDLHQGNVLYKNIPETKGFIKIKTHLDKIHYIPNIGVKFFPWDYGASRSPPFISNPGYDSHFKNFMHLNDIIRLVGTLDLKHVQQRKIRHTLTKLLKESRSLYDFLDLIYEEINKIRPYIAGKDKIIDTFDENNGPKNLLLDSFKKINRKIVKENIV